MLDVHPYRRAPENDVAHLSEYDAPTTPDHDLAQGSPDASGPPRRTRLCAGADRPATASELRNPMGEPSGPAIGVLVVISLIVAALRTGKGPSRGTYLGHGSRIGSGSGSHRPGWHQVTLGGFRGLA
jgi:hypothetical protein